MSKDYLKDINEILVSMDKEKVSLQNDFDDEGILDSIELIDFFVSIEKKFGLKVAESEIYENGLTKVSTLISYLDSK